MKKLSSILAAVLCLAMLLSVTALAAGSTAESPFGGSAQASGSSITVKLTLEEGQDIHSGQLKLTWNTSEATLSSAALGASASECALHSLDTVVSGEVELGFADLDLAAAGELLTATFTSRKTGSVAFTVTATGYGEDAPEITYTLTAENAVAYTAPVTTPTEPSVTTDDVTEDGETTTETTATPDASVQDGHASSTVSDAMGEEIVKQAQENQSDTVVVAPKISGDVTKAEVTVPAQTVTDIAENTDAALRVETPVGTVTLPAKALPELGQAGDVTVSVEKTEETVSVQVSAGGKAVEAVSGGIKASFTLNDGEVAVVVAEDGTETVVPKSLVDENGVAYVLLDGSATVKIVNNSKDFEDVTDHNWFADAVDFASSHELFNGVSLTSFAPNENMNRAMLSTVLWRLEDEDPASVHDVFADVAGGSWYEGGVAWANEHGIALGYGNNEFRPVQDISREEMALMIYRYAEYVGMDITGRASLSRFTDGDKASTWARDALEWAVSNGLLNGKGNGILDPSGPASRAEVAKVLQHLITLMVK